MAAPAAGTTAPSGDVEDMYYFKILSARGLELEKKDVQLYVKGKCVGTKQTLKTKMVDGFKPEWKEELMFSLNPSKVRKMADRIIEFKLMCKAHVMMTALAPSRLLLMLFLVQLPRPGCLLCAERRHVVNFML